MATRATSRWAWRWPGKVRAAAWPAVFLALVCPANVLRAGEALPADAPSSKTATAALEYRETAYGIFNWSVSITPQSAPFNKEPTAVSGSILRGVLNFGGDSSNSIPFVWQRGAGKLYLDLNRNRDLTDDPAGAFSARVQGERFSQTFTNVHLLFNTAAGKYPVLADLSFWVGGVEPYCTVELRSFWRGKVTLQGRDCQVGVVQNDLSQSGSFENSRLLLRPWDKRNQPFNTYDGSLATFPFSRNLFVDGHAYQPAWIGKSPSGEVKPALQFTEQSVPLGELKITGKFIQRLVLPGGTYLVVLDQPAASVQVPTGSYNQPDIRLEQNGTEAYCNSTQPQVGGRISVADQAPGVLNVGGPLTNSVTANRHGRDLQLDYQLVGAGGNIYQLANQNRSRPPEFAIYKGGRKIASGKFEFG